MEKLKKKNRKAHGNEFDESSEDEEEDALDLYEGDSIRVSGSGVPESSTTMFESTGRVLADLVFKVIGW